MTDAINLSADSVTYSFSVDHAPTIEVDSGATIAVETRDAYDRRSRAASGVQCHLADRDRSAGNPVTGPIAVRGLLPGDGLNVTIEKIALGSTGYVAAAPGIGVLGDRGIESRVVTFEVHPDGLWFDGRLRLPLRPMVGTIGVAPANGAISSLLVGRHGGNLDCNDVAVGATVHLPVFVPGGLLGVGDVHAGMGFGEVYSGVNIDAVVTLTVARVPRAGWARPWFETAAELMTLGIGATVEDAIREATADMTELLQSRLGLSFTEAVVLTGAACDLRAGQTSKFGMDATVYAAFPKSALTR